MILRTAKSFARRIVELLPGGSSLLRRRLYNLQAKRFKKLGGGKEVFRHHYENNAWSNEESVSGPGSTLQYTEKLRIELPKLVAELGVSHILDAPCGDFNWMQHVKWDSAIQYVGADIVDSLVEKNQEIHGTPYRHFISLDITRGPLPCAGLWLCRDCLFHLSNRDIFRVLDNFVHSEIEFLLTTSYPNCKINHDIPTGSFRYLNLTLRPFFLNPPTRIVEDWSEGHPERIMGLWTKNEVRRSIGSASRNG